MEAQERGGSIGRLLHIGWVGWLTGLPLLAVGFRYPIDAVNGVVDRGSSLAGVALVALSLLVWLVPMRMASWAMEEMLGVFAGPETGAVRRAAVWGSFPAVVVVGGYLIPFLLDRVLYDLGGAEPWAQRWLFDWVARTV